MFLNRLSLDLHGNSTNGINKINIQLLKRIKKTLTFLIAGNTVLFLGLAYLNLLSTAPKAAVFIDFWGRFTVYSLWFIGFAVYETYLRKTRLIRWIILTLVCVNIPFFLLLAYFDKISNTPDTIIFVDFWGRITVYSLWVISYELYRVYIEDALVAESQG